MTTFLLFCLKLNLAITVFYLFYLLVVSRDTFYKQNRFYFLAIIPLIFAFPFADLINLQSQMPFVINNISDYTEIKVSGAEKTTDIYQIITAVILCGIAVFSISFIKQLSGILRLIYKSNSKQLNGCRIITTGDNTYPFSFFKNIFINPNLHDDGDLSEILAHEHVHANQYHTIDILIYQAVTVFCWYNPFIWFLKRSMNQNLEFLTDEQILNAGYDRRHYQYNLLKVSQITASSEFVNNFSFNHLKKRIIMMNREKVHKLNLLKYLLVLPIVFTMVALNAQTKKADEITITTNEAVTVATSVMAFDKAEHDFGTVKESDATITTVFTFVNNSNKPLVVTNVKAACGCTTPEWTKEPIAVGEKGYIKVAYGTTGRVAPFDKTVTVYSNTNPEGIVLRIKGNVIK